MRLGDDPVLRGLLQGFRRLGPRLLGDVIVTPLNAHLTNYKVCRDDGQSPEAEVDTKGGNQLALFVNINTQQ